MTRHDPHARARPRAAHTAARRGGGRPFKRWIWIVLGAAAVAVVALLLRPGASGPEQVSAQQAYEKFMNGATILDVRSQEEWDAAHIPGSIVIPLDELSARLSEVPTEREIVVVCTKGARSSEGARLLVEAGIPDVACLQAGLIEWQAAGYPLEASSP